MYIRMYVHTVHTSKNRHCYCTVSYLLEVLGWVRCTYICTQLYMYIRTYVCIRLQRNKQNQVTFLACMYAHMHAAEQCDVVDDTCSSGNGHSRTG